MSSKKKSAGLLDWTAGHTPGWGAVNGAGVSLATASVGYLAHAPLYTGVAEGVAGAVAAVAVASRRHYSPGHRLYRAAAWLVAGGWTSWAMHVGPWSSWLPVTALAAGATLAWGCGAAYDQHERDAPERRRLAAEAARREETGDVWEERLKRVAHIEGAQVVAVEVWHDEETGDETGYTLEVRLPGGATADMITQYTLPLRSDLRLPLGCSLEVASGVDYGSALIKVNTLDTLGQLRPIPQDWSPTSISEPLALGVYRDGSRALAALRYHCGLIIGQPEGGKTNLINVINSQLMRCADVLVWHIDTTGAGISLPWLRAYAREGTADTPAVDWVASTVDEADLMLTVAAEMIAARKMGYQDLMYSVDDDKIPVSHELPEIVILADEVAQLPVHIQEGISTVINTGRASAFRVVNSALRGTRDMVSPAMREMTRLRIAMRVSDESEYQHIFSDARGLKSADASVPGSGFLEADGGKPRPAKIYRIVPSNIVEISKTVAAYRPVMDAVSLTIESADVYRNRWARTLRQLYAEGTPLSDAARAILDAGPAAPAAATAAGQTAPSSGLDMAALFPLSKPKAAPAPAAATPPPAAAPVPQQPVQQPQETPDVEARRDLARVLDDATWHLGELPEAAAPPSLGPVAEAPAVTDSAQRLALELLDRAGAQGLGVTALTRELEAAGMGRDRTTVHRWITTWAARGTVVRQERGAGAVAYVMAEYDRFPKSHSA